MEIISKARREADLADQIVARTYEVYAYDLNIQNYETLAAADTREWPERLLPLRDLAAQDAAARCAPEDVDLLAALQLRDRVAMLVKTEKVERAKAAAILEVLDAQLTGPGRDAALEAAIARRDASLAG